VGRSWNPSRKAASRSRLSRHTKLSPVGSSSQETSAAANWRASAARRGWTASSLPARRRTSSVAATVSEWSRRSPNRRRALSSIALGSGSSRCRRKMADLHSTRVPHQITGMELERITFVISPERASGRSRGTKAELSQNTGASGPRRALKARRKARPPRCLRDLWEARATIWACGACRG